VALAWGAIYVSTTHELPAPLPEYFNSGLDPLLRDDIHQSELGYRLYAELIGSHIVEFVTRVNKSGRALPAYMTTSKVTAIQNSCMLPNSFRAYLTVANFSNGDVLVNLPRWCRPDRPLNTVGWYVKGDGTYPSCNVYFLNGRVKVDGLTLTNTDICIEIFW
jgi:hypothetical protein